MDNPYVPTPVESSPEAGAKYLLSIFINNRSARPGTVLKSTDFMMPLGVHPWSPSMFNVYMDFAIERGWVEGVDEVSFRLTEAGARAV